jgi:hypothetical protein
MHRIVIGLLFTGAGLAPALAQQAQPDLVQQQAILKTIADTAAQICYTVTQEGQQRETELSGTVRAQLNGIIAKVADLGGEGNAKLKTEKYQGVLQEQLAVTLKHSADCRKDVFDRLVAVMLPAPLPPARIVPGPPAAPPPLPANLPPARQSAALCGRPVDYALDLAQSRSGFLGVWSGNWNNSGRLCGGLIVEKVHSDTADIIYVYGPSQPGSGLAWRQQRVTGLLNGDNRLSFTDDQGSTFVFDLMGPGALSGKFESKSGQLNASFQKL